MTWLQNLPIKQRLTMLILTTCLGVLLLACLALAAFELFDFRRVMIRDMTVLADVLGRNVQAALVFQDESAAQETLRALQAEPQVIAACVYDPGGHQFAKYLRPGTESQYPAQPGPDGERFEDGHLVLYRPVNLDGKRIGTIFLKTDLSRIYERLRMVGGITGLVLMGSFLWAWVLASWLQRPISQPILDLAKTARLIAEDQDFSVRATRTGLHEVDLLTDAFNQMLTGIEDRENALRTANESLQEEIVERKRAEGKAQAQLERLELLHQITRAIGERQDLFSIFQVAISSLEASLPIDFGCACLFDPSGQVLTIANIGQKSELIGNQLSLTREAQIPILENGLERCLNGQLVYEADISQMTLPFPQRLAEAGLSSLVVAPLVVEDRVFGIFLLARREGQSFSSPECEFLRQLSEHVALAAHQSQLYTALQKAYDELRQTQQAVMEQDRLRALGQMASGIAHDINNALSPVALYTESLLERELNISQRSRGYLKTIQQAVEDVAQTVSRMREFYRQREPQLTLTAVILNQVVEQVVNLTRARWENMPQERGVVIELRKDLMMNLPVIMGVESEIREALTNLIFNAVDAMPRGGTLIVRTKVMPGDQGKSETDSQSMVAVEVIDNGIGMDETTRRRCLEPFFTTKGERGTGLGLAMVYGMVQRHSSAIQIESVLGQGTTIRLLFAVPTEVIPEKEPSLTPIRVTRLKLLLVDDDPLVIKSLRETLEIDGHDVTIAGGGREGIESCRSALDQKQPFSVVITDLGMPKVDGRQVAEAIKKMSPATPVILLTGWGQRLTAEGEIPPHVDLVLSKPPKLRELREALTNCSSGSAV